MGIEIDTDNDPTHFDPPNERRISGGAFLLSLLAFLAVLPFALREGPDWAVIPAITFAAIAGLVALWHGIEYVVRRRRTRYVYRTRAGAGYSTRYAL